MQLPCPDRLLWCYSMNWETRVFYPPLSHLTLDGRPKLLAAKKEESIVSALLFIEA